MQRKYSFALNAKQDIGIQVRVQEDQVVIVVVIGHRHDLKANNYIHRQGQQQSKDIRICDLCEGQVRFHRLSYHLDQVHGIRGQKDSYKYFKMVP